MRLARLSRAALALAAILPFASCHSSPTTPSTGLTAVLGLKVTPNPITSVITNALGPTYTAQWTINMTELGGVGGVVQLVRATVFDDATGLQVASTSYDSNDLLVFVGKNRLEAKGTLDVPLQVSYGLSTLNRAATLTIYTTLKDDKGFTAEGSYLVKIQ